MADILLSVGFQPAKGEFSQFQSELDKLVNSLGGNKPKVKVGLQVAPEAITEFKNQIQGVLNTLSLGNGAPITLKIDNVGRVTSELGRVEDTAKRVSDAVKNIGDGAGKKFNLESANKQIENVRNSLEQYRKDLISLNNSGYKTGLADSYMKDVEAGIKEYNDALNDLGKKNTALDKVTSAFTSLRAEMTMLSSGSGSIKKINSDIDSMSNGLKTLGKDKDVSSLTAELDALIKKRDQLVESFKSGELTIGSPQSDAKIRALSDEVAAFTEKYQALKQTVGQDGSISFNVESATKDVESLSNRIGDLFSSTLIMSMLAGSIRHWKLFVLTSRHSKMTMRRGKKRLRFIKESLPMLRGLKQN